jgi:histidine ammonia-lyase
MILDGRNLSPAAVAQVARSTGERVAVEPEGYERVRRDRAVVDDAVARRLRVYGVTTGLGARASFSLPAEELAEFSVRTVRGRANAVGRPLPRGVVRGALVVRCNGIVHGGSGVQPAVLELLMAMLNHGLHPVVPEIGSIGASDLNQMAHVGLAVMGEGEAELGGERLPAGVALARAGLAPVALGAKDGLALCNSNALSAGSSALAYHDARGLHAAAQVVAALSFEGFRANTTPLDPRVQAARPVAEQQACAGQLRELLADGSLLDPVNARRLQDPISFRSVAHVHGALRAALSLLEGALDPELNGAGDNPLVLADEREILSTGNFATPALALALDTLALAICQTASISAQRTQRLLAGSLTDLPENLSPHGAERSGYAPLVKTSQALVAELRHLAAPLTIDPQPGAAQVEDDSSNAPAAARRTTQMLERLRYVLAIEALVASQAVDLAAPATVGRGPAVLHRAVRSRAPRLEEDRSSADEIERLAAEVFGAGAIGELLDQAGIGADWSAGARLGW